MLLVDCGFDAGSMVLVKPEFGIKTIFSYKIIMGACLGNFSVIHIEYDITISNAGKSVSDSDESISGLDFLEARTGWT